ncbi:MAG: hypothetical protein N2745_07670 [Syntrophorhabdaceae bacterium]|nr:hypothetical protein [Syntrophorhabdaceae bacterium]
MKLREAISSFLLIPIGKTLSGRHYFKAKAYQRLLEGMERRPIDEIEAFQNIRLKQMIEYAYENTPYYRELFDREGIVPSDIKGRDDLKGVPFLTKDILNRNLDRLISRNVKPKDLRKVSTGGTTGTPITFFRDHRSEWMVDGSNWRFWRYCKYELGHTLAKLWGNENDLLQSVNLYGKLKAVMDNETALNFYDLSEERLKGYVAFIKKKRPRIWKGFSSAVYTFMRDTKRHNEEIPLPEAVIITSDRIEEAQRKELNEFFNNRVFDEYGCREFSILGFECEAHKGIHVGMENAIIEIVPGNNESGYGEVVVTSLINWGMPFIRYRLGDSSIFAEGDCPCGRKLPRLKSIGGRIADFVVTKSRKLIYGDFFAHLLYGTKGIEHYRVIQEEAGRVIVLLEKNEFYSEEETKRVLSQFEEMVKDDLEIEILFVDKIEMHASGKRRSVISKISKEYLP